MSQENFIPLDVCHADSRLPYKREYGPVNSPPMPSKYKAVCRDCDCGAKPRVQGQIVKATTRRLPQGQDVRLISKVPDTNCWLCKWAEGHRYTYVLESEMSPSIKPASHYL